MAAFQRHAIKVKAFFKDSKVGLKGAVGVILMDGTPLYLCSVEKWSLGLKDSLRRGWDGDVRIGVKTMYVEQSESEMRAYGLRGLTVPKILQV